MLAEDVTAAVALPSFDNSSMDGYAVHAADVAGAAQQAPAMLPVTGEIAAGDVGAYRLAPGTAIKIMTGARLPAEADAVVPVEWTDGGIAAGRRLPRGGAWQRGPLRGRRRGRGRDAAFRRGAHAADADRGRGFRGPQGGHVRPRPRVVVLSTGDELTEPGTPLVPGRIWDSNSYMIAACAREAGAVAFRHSVVPDDPAGVLPALEEQLSRADLLITTGGVSMGGEHDVVKAALRELGTVTFRKVAMQPGMPQGFGVIGPDKTPIFTLPGNPVSAYVSFQVFVRPAIAALQGADDLSLPAVRATLTGPVRSPAGTALLPARRARRQRGHPPVRAAVAPSRLTWPGQRADRRPRAGNPAPGGPRRPTSSYCPDRGYTSFRSG